MTDSRSLGMANETLRERVAAAIPPHSFISEAQWDDCNEYQRDRRRDLAEAVLATVADWLQHIDRMDEIPSAKRGMPYYNPLWDAGAVLRGDDGL